MLYSVANTSMPNNFLILKNAKPNISPLRFNFRELFLAVYSYFFKQPRISIRIAFHQYVSLTSFENILNQL